VFGIELVALYFLSRKNVKNFTLSFLADKHRKGLFKSFWEKLACFGLESWNKSCGL